MKTNRRGTIRQEGAQIAARRWWIASNLEARKKALIYVGFTRAIPLLKHRLGWGQLDMTIRGAIVAAVAQARVAPRKNPDDAKALPCPHCHKTAGAEFLGYASKACRFAAFKCRGCGKKYRLDVQHHEVTKNPAVRVRSAVEKKARKVFHYLNNHIGRELSPDPTSLTIALALAKAINAHDKAAMADEMKNVAWHWGSPLLRTASR